MRRTSASPMVVAGEEFCCYYRDGVAIKTEWRNENGDIIRRNFNTDTYSAWTTEGTLIGKRFRNVKNAAMAVISRRNKEPK